MWNSSKPIKFPHLWKLANQSTLKKADVIEITKACKVAFMKARDYFVARYWEESANWKNKQTNKNRMVRICFLKLPPNRVWLISKSCSCFNKVAYGRPSKKWTSWKGDMFTWSRLDVQFVKIISWKWSLVNRWKKRGRIQIINGFYI